MRRRQFYSERAQRLGQAVAPPCPDQWHDILALILALGRDPSDRDLGHRRADIVGNYPQPVDQAEIGVEVVALEARAHLAKILTFGLILRPVPADQAARQHAIGSDADAEFPA